MILASSSGALLVDAGVFLTTAAESACADATTRAAVRSGCMVELMT
ncbi:hypothetical protein HMPREF0281_01466 [Corynebacterium ammoniagenes DSM 20306]|uniref:Uncharacterized protein n=1 Tax=Corynebacterium ammoniagenes DSM 20306 TaxID=649754 RepID=A0ABN0AEQ9_CORAM|nr:hypothetical protein HMPREF0281_01466 [Corynebacterium ammoniagenes DSM 20306]